MNYDEVLQHAVGTQAQLDKFKSDNEANLINKIKTYADRLEIPKEEVEFQMLYGIRRELQEKLVADGYQIRIYVPYGTAWYPYFVRRLAERPANLWFFINNFFRN